MYTPSVPHKDKARKWVVLDRILSIASKDVQLVKKYVSSLSIQERGGGAKEREERMRP